MLKIASIKIISVIRMIFASNRGHGVISEDQNLFKRRTFLRERKTMHENSTPIARISNPFISKL